VKYVRPFVSFLKINRSELQTNYLKIHRTGFHRIFAIWWVFDRRLLNTDLTPFSDRSRNIAMTTNFRIKNERNRLTHLYSLPWHSKTEWNIAIPI